MDELNALRSLYEAYLEGYAQRLEDAGPFRGLSKFLRGNSSPADRRADTDFYKAVEQAAAGLADADGDTLSRAVRYMALEAKGVDPSSSLMMEACQGLAVPLAGKLSREDAADILALYKARYPKKRLMVPRQRELLEALEAAAK